MAEQHELPVVVIGGGPVGLAAAAHLIDRDIPVRLYEAGATVGASVRDWGHVRTFSPWRYNIDAASRKLLQASQWREPLLDAMPSGAEIYDEYLRPLAATPEMSAVIETAPGSPPSRGMALTRSPAAAVPSGHSRLRSRPPLALHVVSSPAPSSMRPAPGPIPIRLAATVCRRRARPNMQTQIAYGIPDVLGRPRRLYAGRRILVVGAGHSAANALLDLVKLAGEAPGTEISWAVRGKLERVYGGGDADQLAARAELGAEVKRIVEFRPRPIDSEFFDCPRPQMEAGELRLTGDTAVRQKQIGPFDRIIVATGQRPDLSLTRELRLELDPWLESVRALGPLIDPNEHSCGSVPPHGHRELSHPEPGFYTVGIKSYGRAPTFLLLTGYEQVRSVAAAIAGDMAAADDVQLVLPETGVCVTPSAAEGCCGGPAPNGVEACCAADAEAKAVGETGCGCGPATATKASTCFLLRGLMADLASAGNSWRRSRGATVTLLGVTQILAWGSSYYLPAVLAGAISLDTGWGLTWVVGGLSLGLIAAGLISPLVGSRIGRGFGREVLAASAVLLASGLLCIGAGDIAADLSRRLAHDRLRDGGRPL